MCTIEFRGGEDSEDPESTLPAPYRATNNEKFHLRMGTRRFHDGREVGNSKYVMMAAAVLGANLIQSIYYAGSFIQLLWIGGGGFLFEPPQ